MAEDLLNTASQHRLAGRLDEAEAAYRQILSSNPHDPAAMQLLGILCIDLKRYAEAIEILSFAASLAPSSAAAHANLGIALHGDRQINLSVDAYRRAISLDPKYAEAYSFLGNSLRDNGLTDEAIAAFERAIELKPAYAEAYYNLANAMNDKRLFHPAETAFRQAIKLNPLFAEAHSNLASTLLIQGKLQQGWQEYEWRWRVRDFKSPTFSHPKWDGSNHKGGIVLVHGEQGFGDAIQMARYVPLVAAQARVIFGCHPGFSRILQFQDVRQITLPATLPANAFDSHCPLGSLPLAFGTTVGTIPPPAPITIPAGLTDAWAKQIRPGKVRVGLCWAGNPAQSSDKLRSLVLPQLAPLAGVPGVTFYSLQKGYAAAQAFHPPPGMDLLDLTPAVEDFADTAALIANLDLVITTCTSIAHLAGSMGKPTWIMLPFVADWRWMLDREDSPWYPSVRLFRQKTRGDWTEVIERVAGELRAMQN